jgi:hypothetical protein
MIRSWRHWLFGSSLLLIPFGVLGRASSASAEPPSCSTYSIVGTVDDAGVATAYLHFDDEPLVGHEVFVVFSGGVTDPAPAVVVTGPAGTAEVAVPIGVNAVSFSAESPVADECGGVSAPNEQPEVVVVSDTVWAPGADPLSPTPEPGAALVEFDAHPEERGPLAVTGPVSPAIVVFGGLTLASGWFVRRLRNAEV